MALRGGMTRRVPGNPMASILRDLDRRTRTTTRRARPARPETDEQHTEPAPTQAAPKPPAPGVVAFALVAGEDGGVRVEFPRPFAAPVVVASVIGSASDVAVVEEVTSSHAVVRVLSRSSARRTPGVSVHVIVTEATG